MNSKATRGKNFTEREKSMLLTIVDKHKHILENKATNAANIYKKVQTWEKVASEFNSRSEVLRSTKQLQTAYLNLKRVTRKNVADKNMENYLARSSTQAVLDNVNVRYFFNNIIQLVKFWYNSRKATWPVCLCERARHTEQTLAKTNSLPQDEEKEKEQLMKDLLKRLKKDEVADKKGIKATGGGCYKPLLDDVGSQMIAIMGDQIQPLHNNCDSASSYYGHDQEQSANVGDKNEVNNFYTFEDPNQEQSVNVGNENEDNIFYTFEEPSETTTKTNTNSNIIKKRRISHTVTSEGVKHQARSQKKVLKQKNTSAEDLRKEYYRKKLECAVIEKKARLVEFKINFKRLQLLNLEIKKHNQ